MTDKHFEKLKVSAIASLSGGQELIVEVERLRAALEGLYWKHRIEMSVQDVEKYIDAALGGTK